MPYSFTQIEEDKTKVIGFVFGFLVLFYFLAASLIYFVTKFFWILEESYDYDSFHRPMELLSPVEFLIMLSVAALIGFIHWSISTHRLIPKILNVLGAEPINPKDTYHQIFQNIIDEVSVATGGKKIEGVVIPTMAMNAFALADFEGRSVIGATEGLLARLSRPQLEAVVGHEAAHVVSGDCLSTTVTSSLFKLYSSVLSRMSSLFQGEKGYYGRVPPYFLVIYALIAMINAISFLLNMFISRQREFRADAIAVRLTRDPLSLAEALYMMTYRWRGEGLAGQELEAIFIINPQFSRLDEKSGLAADLFSTHPPIEKRIHILLNMAHAGIEDLERKFHAQAKRPRQMLPEEGVPFSQMVLFQDEWIVHKDGQWQGPFSAQELISLEWLRPEMWIKKMGTGTIKRVYEEEAIQSLWRKQGPETVFLCPHCRISLTEILYEGTPLLSCPSCRGVLTSPPDITKILLRQDFSFPERVRKLAERIRLEQEKIGPRRINLKAAYLFDCPKCTKITRKMVRSFYSYAYYVEVDKCLYCGSVWFDKDELEILQYIVEESVKKSFGS